MGRKRRTYDDKFRRDAVLMLEAAGYPDRKGALVQVERALNVPGRTISRWFNGENNPPPDRLVSEKRPSLIELIKAEAYNALNVPDEVRAEAGYKDRVTAGAILIDKMQLLEGKATERIEHITPEQRANRIRELLDVARDRRDQQVASH